MKANKTVSQARRKTWTTEELLFVEKHYGSLMVSEIAGHLGRTPGSVKSMARRLGCGGKQLHWTDADISVLKADYAAGADKAAVMAMLPGRTWSGIMSKVYVLGIIRRKWRPEECHILAEFYASEGVRVAERLPGRTASAVQNQAYAMKLRHSRGMRWDEDELKRLVQNLHLPLAELATLFPRRSRMAVYHLRGKLIKHQTGVNTGREEPVDEKVGKEK